MQPLPTHTLRLLLIGLTGFGFTAISHAVTKPHSQIHTQQNGYYADTPHMEDIFPPEVMAAYEGFQSDADIVRLNHMQYWVDIIEEYHDKTGRYPLQYQTTARLNVLIATPRQQQYTYQIPGIKEATMTSFVNTLEQGLGRDIEEYYDPQYAPDAKPNYYIYMIDGDRYYFAIHTHKHYPFSREVARYYNKVEVSNKYTRDVPHILKPETLFESAAYIESATKPIQKQAFFAEREALTLHATKED